MVPKSKLVMILHWMRTIKYLILYNNFKKWNFDNVDVRKSYLYCGSGKIVDTRLDETKQKYSKKEKK